MADVVVAGAAGRMGCRLVANLAGGHGPAPVGRPRGAGASRGGQDAGEVAGVGRSGVAITDKAEGALGADRILIEFSVPEATLAHLRLVARIGGRAVIGTTGLSPAQREEIAGLARQAPHPPLSQHERGGQRRLSRAARTWRGCSATTTTWRSPRSTTASRRTRPSGTALADGGGGGGGAGARPRRHRGVRPPRPARRADAPGDRHLLAPLGRRGGRPHGVLRRPRRAPRAHPSRAQPRQLRAGCPAGGSLHRRRAPRSLLHARRPRTAAEMRIVRFKTRRARCATA